MTDNMAYRDKTDEFSFKLGPSMLINGGVGVFCLHGIAKGTHLRLFCNRKPTRKTPLTEVEPGSPLWKLARIFGIEDREEGVWWLPDDFGSMDIGWYLNHSPSPNAKGDESDDTEYFALRDINMGEEITVDYADYPDWDQDELNPNRLVPCHPSDCGAGDHEPAGSGFPKSVEECCHLVVQDGQKFCKE